MKRSKKVIGGLSIIMILSLIGCGKEDKLIKSFNEYSKLWQEQDFKSMYQLLSNDSQKYISEEEFINRYTNIYSAMEIYNIQLSNTEESKEDSKDNVIPFVLNAETVAGEINLDDFKLEFVEEDQEYKVNWSEALIFPEMVEGDKVRVELFEAERGSITDRNGNIIAGKGEVKTVCIYPAVFNSNNSVEKIKEIANTLDISEETITNKLSANSNDEYLVEIVDVLPNDEKINTLVNRENDGIIIKSNSARVYYGGEAIGRLIGYIGEITEEELKANTNQGYDYTSLIGKAGLEQVYEKTLKGINGAEIYLDRNGEYITIAQRESENGQDIQISVDLELQKKIYDEFGDEKGAATVVDPKSGEVLAMVSAPSYDSNIYTTYITKTESEKRKANNYADEENRFSKTYSPGSTMKMITAAIGLNDELLDPDEEFDIQGFQWQKDESWGDYKITRVIDPGTAVTLREAAKYSDNIYFAQAALKIGAEKLIEGIKGFGIGEEMKFEYPMEESSITNTGELTSDIMLADTGYGQGELMVTPLNMSLSYSALANNGDIMVPRLVISENSTPEIWKKQAIKSDKIAILVEDFSAIINDDDGSANFAKIEGVNIAAKTGTAEIKQSQDDENGTENSWFVAVDTESSKIAISMIVEDVKNRGGSAIPTEKVANILKWYYNK